MKITNEQRAAWQQELDRRKEMAKKGAEKTASDLDAKTRAFFFDINPEQMGNIILELQPIIDKYDAAYRELEEGTLAGRNTNAALARATDLTESKLTSDQRLAVFMGFHCSEQYVKNMALSVLWYCNYRSLLHWITASYPAAVTEDIRRERQEKYDDDRNDALLEMYDLYENFDYFKDTAFNSFAENYMPAHLRAKRLPAGVSYDDFTNAFKTKAIRKNLATEMGIPEEKVPFDDVAREFNRPNINRLYDKKGEPNDNYYKFRQEVADDLGVDPESLTKENVETEFYKRKTRSRLSLAKYNQYINFKMDEHVSLDANISDDEDDEFSIADTLTDGGGMGFSEDVLPPEQRLLRQESDFELRKKLLRILNSIPMPEIMLDVIMEYSESDPVARAKQTLKKKKKDTREKDVQKELEKMFTEYVSKEYSNRYVIVSERTARKYAETAFHKLVLLDRGKSTADFDLMLDVDAEDVFPMSNKELGDDIFQDDNLGSGAFSGSGSRGNGNWNFARDIDDGEFGADIDDFDGIFD